MALASAGPSFLYSDGPLSFLSSYGNANYSLRPSICFRSWARPIPEQQRYCLARFYRRRQFSTISISLVQFFSSGSINISLIGGGTDFIAALEEADAAFTFQAAGLADVTIAGPNHSSNVASDDDTPYTWTPSNAAELATFYAGLTATLSVSITIRDTPLIVNEAPSFSDSYRRRSSLDGRHRHCPCHRTRRRWDADANICRRRGSANRHCLRHRDTDDQWHAHSIRQQAHLLFAPPTARARQTGLLTTRRSPH